jgi:hypothetical protein
LGKFYEPALGIYQYRVQGQTANDGKDVFLVLTPDTSVEGMLFGNIEVKAALRSPDEFSGRWTSTLTTEGMFRARRQPDSPKTSESTAPVVFLVHGHDEATKEKVARFIEKLGI